MAATNSTSTNVRPTLRVIIPYSKPFLSGIWDDYETAWEEYTGTVRPKSATSLTEGEDGDNNVDVYYDAKPLMSPRPFNGIDNEYHDEHHDEYYYGQYWGKFESEYHRMYYIGKCGGAKFLRECYGKDYEKSCSKGPDEYNAADDGEYLNESWGEVDGEYPDKYYSEYYGEYHGEYYGEDNGEYDGGDNDKDYCEEETFFPNSDFLVVAETVFGGMRDEHG